MRCLACASGSDEDWFEPARRLAHPARLTVRRAQTIRRGYSLPWYLFPAFHRRQGGHRLLQRTQSPFPLAVLAAAVRARGVAAIAAALAAAAAEWVAMAAKKISPVPFL